MKQFSRLIPLRATLDRVAGKNCAATAHAVEALYQRCAAGTIKAFYQHAAGYEELPVDAWNAPIGRWWDYFRTGKRRMTLPELDHNWRPTGRDVHNCEVPLFLDRAAFQAFADSWKQAAPSTVVPAAVVKRKPGPEPGKIGRFDLADRALFSEIDTIMKAKQLSLTEAVRSLPSERLEGRGGYDSRVRRVVRLYNRDKD